MCRGLQLVILALWSYQEAEVGPVVDEVAVGIDGVRLREVRLHQSHDVGQLQLRFVLHEGDTRGTLVSRLRYCLLRRQSVLRCRSGLGLGF